MKRVDREKIDSHCDEIVPRIDMTRLWPKLLEHEIYYPQDVNIPRWIVSLSSKENIKDIILNVKTRGPDAFKNLILSLKQTGHSDVASILQNNEEEMPNNTANNFSTPVNNNNNSNNDSVEFNLSQHMDNFYTILQETEKPLVIKVKKATEFLDTKNLDFMQAYPMRSKPRGIVLLISNIKFEWLENRDTAEYDHDNLEKLFTDMGFKVIAFKNLSSRRILEECRKLSQSEELRLVDSCFVIISSHGKSDRDKIDNLSQHDDDYEINPEIDFNAKTVIQGTDYKPYFSSGSDNTDDSNIIHCEDIYNYFTSTACTNLMGKPKIFIFQICRGKNRQQAVKSDRTSTDVGRFKLANEQNAIVANRVTQSGDKLHRNYADMAIVHSTLPTIVSFRDTVVGSWFIQILCEVFMNHAKDSHLTELFSEVDDRLSRLRTFNNMCQSLDIRYIGFGKKCFLNPGLFQ